MIRSVCQKKILQTKNNAKFGSFLFFSGRFRFSPGTSVKFQPLAERFLGKSKWGLSNGGLRPLSAICPQSSTVVHFCGLFGPLSKGNFRHKMTTIVGNRGQLWTSALSPHLLSPHLDFPEILKAKKSQMFLNMFGFWL